MDFLTIGEVTSELQVSEEVVHDLIRAGLLKAFEHTASPRAVPSLRICRVDVESLHLKDLARLLCPVGG